MSDSGDPKQDKQRELEAEREHYQPTPTPLLDESKLDDLAVELNLNAAQTKWLKTKANSLAEEAMLELIGPDEDGFDKNDVSGVRHHKRIKNQFRDELRQRMRGK